MVETYNWVLFAYNGNSTEARLIIEATIEQVQFFCANGGNQDDDPEWLFEDMSNCQLIAVPKDSLGLGNSTNPVAWSDGNEETWTRICDLPVWVVDYTEYPDGKIVRKVGDSFLTADFAKLEEATMGIQAMEHEAERDTVDPETPAITGRNGF